MSRRARSSGRRVASGALAALIAVAAAAPAHAQSAPNDPLFEKQWGHPQMHVVEAWAASRGEGVTIAVVDSGVDTAHPDLKAKLVAGYDFADGDNNPDDDSTARDGSGATVKGHGTHVAGIAAAITDNATGIAGTAPGAKIMPVKAFTSGSGSLLGFTAVPDSIRYATNNGAKVINLSLGTFSTGVSIIGFIEAPCAEALQRGVLCVVAAGNSGDEASGYPRDFPGLVVAAGTPQGGRTSFSQRADTKWSVMGPGQGIRSTIPVEDGGYADKSGTSMASPYVAGIAALVYAKLQPPPTSAGAQQVIDAILDTAVELRDVGAGRGRADAAAALGVPVASQAPATRSADDDGGAPVAAAPRSANTPVGGVVSGGTAPSNGGGAPVAAPPPPGEGAAEGLAPAAPAPTDETADAEAAALLLKPRQTSEEPTAKAGPLAIAAIVAGLMVLGTGWWSGTAFAADRRARRLRPFLHS